MREKAIFGEKQDRYGGRRLDLEEKCLHMNYKITDGRKKVRFVFIPYTIRDKNIISTAMFLKKDILYLKSLLIFLNIKILRADFNKRLKLKTQ